MTGMTPAERRTLVGISKERAKLACADVDSRRKFLESEVLNLMAAEFEANDQLWDSGVAIAEDYVAKANEQIRAQCIQLGIPPKYAPRLEVGFRSRSPEFTDPRRRRELKELAASKLDALTTEAKRQINQQALNAQEQILLAGFETDEARLVLESMSTPEQLMPALSLEDLGVKRWQPPENAAAQLVTPITTGERIKRQVHRALVQYPNADDEEIAAITGLDCDTVSVVTADHRGPRALSAGYDEGADD
jgi:hypothetical protein